ncbi:MAG: hypothetical protein KAR47_12235, partial [Planctomycetes bacterium]|nr:hypothetical protein [Planctomycetota bacterium]
KSDKTPGRLGRFAGIILTVFGGGRREKQTQRDMQRLEFGASTQRIGVRFSEKIRNIYRHLWLKKH